MKISEMTLQQKATLSEMVSDHLIFIRNMNIESRGVVPNRALMSKYFKKESLGGHDLKRWADALENIPAALAGCTLGTGYLNIEGILGALELAMNSDSDSYCDYVSEKAKALGFVLPEKRQIHTLYGHVFDPAKKDD